MSKKPAINLNDPNNIGLISPAYNGATRSQYGHYYDNGGTYLFSVDDEVELAVSQGLTQKAASKLVKSDAVAEQDVSGGDNPPPQTSEEQEVVDLDAWLAGDATYPFFKVKSAVSQKYGVVPANRKQAEEVIKDGGPQSDI